MSEILIRSWKSRFRTGGDYKPDEKFIDILEKSRRRVKRSEHIGSIVKKSIKQKVKSKKARSSNRKSFEL